MMAKQSDCKYSMVKSILDGIGGGFVGKENKFEKSGNEFLRCARVVG